jgi:hypothetical protein
MSGTIPPLPQYAFMAWCSEAQEQLYISLGVKRPGREADHSPPSSAEVKE